MEYAGFSENPPAARARFGETVRDLTHQRAKRLEVSGSFSSACLFTHHVNPF